MAVKINVDAVRSTASQIANINRKISSDFVLVESAINTLNRNWDGTASDMVIGKFNSIKGTYCDNRYNTVNDMVRFLNNQIVLGYEKTEKVIVTAASAFK